MCCRHRYFVVAMIALVALVRLSEITAVDVADEVSTMSTKQSSKPRRETNSLLARLFPRFLKEAISDATRPIYHVWDNDRQIAGGTHSQERQDDNIPDSEVEIIDEVEGAQLLSVSLQVVSTTFGLLADSVRISGETVAGVFGSSVKLTGTAIKTVSVGFNVVSRALDPEQKQPQQQSYSSVDPWGEASSSSRRKELTSERMNDANHGSREYDIRLMQNARKVAAQSIRLVGSVIDGFGESLLLAGAATEYLASTSVGVAEGTVRIVEDFAGALSTTMSPEYARRHASSRPSRDSFPLTVGGNMLNRTYINFGSRSGGNHNNTSDSKRSSEEPFFTFWIDLLNYLRVQISDFPSFLYGDTEGAPSLAPEFLLLFAFCYVATILTMWCSQAEDRDRNTAKSNSKDSTLVTVQTNEHEYELANLLSALVVACTSAVSPCKNTHASKFHPSTHQVRERIFVIAKCTFVVVRSILVGSLLIARTTIHQLLMFSGWLLMLVLRISFHRWTVVFGIYSLAWLYICRACQLRALSIQRNAESAGFRSAVDSIGVSTLPKPESAVWLNAILFQIWRVPLESAAKNSQTHNSGSVLYPSFVARAMEPCYLDACPTSARGTKPGISVPYGGLEPYITSHLGNSLIRTLDLALTSRRKDVAYISLHSFTLGSHPPIARSVKLLGVEKSASHGTRVLLALEADFQLEDFSLVLGVKLSSLQYSMLPSTRIGIQAVSARVWLTMHLSFTPSFPFVSTVEMSLDKAPDVDLRIVPVDDGSGLRGVDVGSLPVIRAKVQDAVRETLSEYVTPNYVSADLVALLTTPWHGSLCESVIPDTVPDIGRLRKTTGHDVNTNPRTSTPPGVGLSSVGSKLNSRDSAIRSVGWKSRKRKDGALRPALLVRPTTELSRLAMDRWLEANNLQVTKSKPCAKKIVNVAGYPWRRIKQIGRSLTKFFALPSPQ